MTGWGYGVGVLNPRWRYPDHSYVRHEKARRIVMAIEYTASP